MDTIEEELEANTTACNVAQQFIEMCHTKYGHGFLGKDVAAVSVSNLTEIIYQSIKVGYIMRKKHEGLV